MNKKRIILLLITLTILSSVFSEKISCMELNKQNLTEIEKKEKTRNRRRKYRLNRKKRDRLGIAPNHEEEQSNCMRMCCLGAAIWMLWIMSKPATQRILK